MTKSMCITYFVEDSLYVNITNRCSNRCDFCIRQNGDGAYGSDSLWLEREPTVDEVLESVFSHNLDSVPELVFCGYGEPSYRLPEAREIALAVKARYPSLRIRINTNGQSDLILGYSTASLYGGAFDCVSVSLNGPTEEKYDAVCHSKYGPRAFDSLLDFVRQVKSYVPDTRLSVVSEFITPEEIRECEALAERLGVTLRVRGYIPPET